MLCEQGVIFEGICIQEDNKELFFCDQCLVIVSAMDVFMAGIQKFIPNGKMAIVKVRYVDMHKDSSCNQRAFELE